LALVLKPKTIRGVRSTVKAVQAVGIAGSQHFNNVWKT
jgi:hypothetical protein